MKTMSNVVVVFSMAVFCACGGNQGQSMCEQLPDDPLCQEANSDTPGGNACQQALDVLGAGISEECVNYPGCCLCQCWQNGRQFPGEMNPCSCTPTTTGPCEGEALDNAESCLADRPTCTGYGRTLVQQACSVQ
ncbi:MAG: hypothetical protein D6806_07340 [Deltaproteobacteria bacterium]|nr:MAG: hypothetical protein D6806_07340 [Deltaproteobacteria bacterium]